MVDLWRDFWIRETGRGQQVAQLHDIYDDDDDDNVDDDNDDAYVISPNTLLLLCNNEKIVNLLWTQELIRQYKANHIHLFSLLATLTRTPVMTTISDVKSLQQKTHRRTYSLNVQLQ